MKKICLHMEYWYICCVNYRLNVTKKYSNNSIMYIFPQRRSSRQCLIKAYGTCVASNSSLVSRSECGLLLVSHRREQCVRMRYAHLRRNYRKLVTTPACLSLDNHAFVNTPRDRIRSSPCSDTWNRLFRNCSWFASCYRAKLLYTVTI